MVNKDFVKEKISLIGEELERLKEFSEFSFQEIASDYKKQAVVERLLERVIMRVIDINQHLLAELAKGDMSAPKDYTETFLKLPEIGVCPQDFAKEIAKSVGTRNVLVHEYNDVDYSKIYGSISDCLKDYHRYCEYILKFLKEG